MNSFDLAITSFVNRFAQRSVRFDEFVIWISTSNLVKGMVVIGIIWSAMVPERGYAEQA